MKFPDRKRVPFALMMSCLLIWRIYGNRAPSAMWHFDGRAIGALVVYVGFCLVLWFDRKRWPRWSLLGIAAGCALLAALPCLYSVLVR
jgi:hypothetical protein